MAKSSNNNNLKEKLDYIGLKLEKIPKFLNISLLMRLSF